MTRAFTAGDRLSVQARDGNDIYGALHPAPVLEHQIAGVWPMRLVLELWAFMRVRKKLWLLPMILLLLLVGMLLVFAQGSALAPFIYTIF